MAQIWVSLLGADAMHYGKAIEGLMESGADSLHIDVFDGVYVRNLAFSPKIVSDIKAKYDVHVDVHLELFEPENYVEMFLDAGADALAYQAGTTQNNIRLLEKIRSYGAKAGLSLNPSTNFADYQYLTDYIDYMIQLSVEPGFGNQMFQAQALEKIKNTSELLHSLEADIPLGVDGSVNESNAAALKQAGVEIYIMGTAITNAADQKAVVASYKEMLQ
ncbi:ribulose-phosphate 3-epimerase [Christensenellaceae bacterium OttesenSCG-928-K19]|nr:ribulose-phosphate 3-epimerase [Christensenellaceae bacterium OttesenSCG-928-K19]